MNEEVITNEVEETAVAVEEPVQDAAEVEVPEYLLVPAEPSEEAVSTDDSNESMTTREKVALGLVGLGVAGIGVGIAAGVKKIKNLKKGKVENQEPDIGPKPIPDTQANAKAIRGRKITLRERLSGHLYLDPAEVEMMQKLYAEQNAETAES